MGKKIDGVHSTNLIDIIEVRAMIWSYGPKCKLLNEFVRIQTVIVKILNIFV